MYVNTSFFNTKKEDFSSLDDFNITVFFDQFISKEHEYDIERFSIFIQNSVQ